MAKTKQLNVSFLAKLIKELNATGELIKVRQDEKQSVINDFEKEKRSYKSGKISESALISSVKKTNKEFMRLDENIRDAMSKSRKIADQIKTLTSNQAPRVFRAHVIGVTASKTPKKRSRKRKSKKKTKRKSKKKSRKKASPKVPGLRAIMKREKTLDRKYQL
jgi:hypothetical protein